MHKHKCPKQGMVILILIARQLAFNAESSGLAAVLSLHQLHQQSVVWISLTWIDFMTENTKLQKYKSTHKKIILKEPVVIHEFSFFT